MFKVGTGGAGAGTGFGGLRISVARFQIASQGKSPGQAVPTTSRCL